MGGDCLEPAIPQPQRFRYFNDRLGCRSPHFQSKFSALTSNKSLFMRSFSNNVVVCCEFETKDGNELTDDQLRSQRFRPIPTPCIARSVSSIMVFSAGLLVVLGVPWASNELGARSTTTRGVIIGVFQCCWLPFTFLVNAPIAVCGRFRWQFILSLPITFCVAFGVAFIPIQSSKLGLVAIILLSTVLSFILCSFIINVPLSLNKAHQSLDLSIGPPFVLVMSSFFCLMTCYVDLTRHFSGSGRLVQFAIGMSLPLGSTLTESCFKALLRRSYVEKYYNCTLDLRADLQNGIALSGDIDSLFGHLISLAALLIENIRFVAGILEVAYSPGSYAWAVGLSFSTILKILKRMYRKADAPHVGGKGPED